MGEIYQLTCTYCDALKRNGEFSCDLFVDLKFKKTTINYMDLKSKRRLSMSC